MSADSPSPPSSSATTSGSARSGMARSVKLTILVLLVGGIAAILDSTMVTLAIRTLIVDLRSTEAVIQWVTAAYLLALGVAVPLSGWLESRIGGKRAWMLALIVFGVASGLCALAWNDVSLITFRAIQGLGGGLIMPLMQTLAIRAAGGRPSTNLIAAVSLPVALGPILGPVVGGIILDQLSWHWLFLVNVPIIVIGLALAWRLLPADPSIDARPSKRLDWIGLVLLAPALVGILLGLSQLASHGDVAHSAVWIPLTAGVVLLAGFVAWALRADTPLVDVRLLRNRSLSSASTVLFTAGAAMFAGMFLLPLFLQQVHGQSVLTAGLLMIAQGAGALLVRFVMSPLVSRFGARAVTIAAFALAAIATVPFALAGPDTSLAWLAAVLFVRGLGIGAVLIPPMAVAYNDVEPPEIAHASMHTRIMQQIGGSFGTAIVATALHLALSSISASTAGGYQIAFWWTTGITLIALIPALLLPGKLHETATP